MGGVLKNEKYRKEKGLTSEEISQLVDLSHDYIRQIQCNNGICTPAGKQTTVTIKNYNDTATFIIE